MGSIIFLHHRTKCYLQNPTQPPNPSPANCPSYTLINFTRANFDKRYFFRVTSPALFAFNSSISEHAWWEFFYWIFILVTYILLPVFTTTANNPRINYVSYWLAFIAGTVEDARLLKNADSNWKVQLVSLRWSRLHSFSFCLHWLI